MIEVEETPNGLRVWDSGNNELFIGTVDWNSLGNSSNIERVDSSISGSVSKLIFPADGFSIKDQSEDNWVSYGSRINDVSLESSEYKVQIHSSIVTYVLFESLAKIQMIGEENKLIISFPGKSEIEIGFRARFRTPTTRVNIPETPKGLAQALMIISDSFETHSADRSYPSMRNHPPQIEVKEDDENKLKFREPDHLRNILIKVPNSFEQIFVISPLAYYLQAKLKISDRETVEISLPDHKFSKQFSNQPHLEKESNDMLRRVFMLDCLVREFGEYPTNLVENKLIHDIGINGNYLYHAKPETRLFEYLNTDFKRIEDKLPKWHLSMYIDPNPSSVGILPFLLHRLSAIYTPKSENISNQEILKASLDKTQRSSTFASNNLLKRIKKPILEDGRAHGWLSDDIPFNAFKATTTSFKNGLEYHQNVGDRRKSIGVVINEHEMEEEFSEVNKIYGKSGSEHNSISLQIYEKLNKHKLKKIIEDEDLDFLHYIGHCDVDGLRCPDGNLSLNSIQGSKVRTFLLNACGSYEEGLRLIKKGSIAGVVTLTPVLDEPAAKVGTTFARMVINGFSFFKALELARKQILMHKYYTIVGDGTYRLTNGKDPFPILLKINRLNDNNFELRSKIDSPQIAGASYQPKLKGKREFRLIGNETIDILSRSELIDFLEESNSPAIFEDDLLWTDDVIERLR